MIAALRHLYYSGIDYLTSKTMDDEYIDWLKFANAGMISRGNIYAMNHVIRNLPTDSPILEIGSFCGLSSNVMNYFLMKHGKKNRIVTCDKWLFERSDLESTVGASRILHRQYREFVKLSFMRNVEFFSSNNKPYTIECFSDEFFQLWEKGDTVADVFGRSIELGGPLSFAYIDGNHTYEFTKRDFQNADRYLDVRGYVLFDDSDDRDTFGLTKLMKEIRSNPRYRLVMKNPNYLFQKIA